MIAVDTSALIAIALYEADARRCAAVLQAEGRVLISAGTVVEATIVAGRRGGAAEMSKLLSAVGLVVVPVTHEAALRIGRVYARWGRGVHPAGLNYGDCFAYDVASVHACPLLFLGDDFSRTDLISAL